MRGATSNDRPYRDTALGSATTEKRAFPVNLAVRGFHERSDEASSIASEIGGSAATTRVSPTEVDVGTVSLRAWRYDAGRCESECGNPGARIVRLQLFR